MGRTPAKLDWDDIDDMIMKGATGTSVADKYGIHPNTFYDRVFQEKKLSFTEYLQQMRSIGDENIHIAQYNKALGITKKGDSTMLIWLGKQRLKQRDSQEEKQYPKEAVEKFSQFLDKVSGIQSPPPESDLNNAESNNNSAEKS